LRASGLAQPRHETTNRCVAWPNMRLFSSFHQVALFLISIIQAGLFFTKKAIYASLCLFYRKKSMCLKLTLTNFAVSASAILILT
jgi:hypothetical protein